MNTETSADSVIKLHLAARCPLLYLVSYEEERVLRQLSPLLSSLFQKTYVWNISDGLTELGGEKLDEKYRGPYETLQFIAGCGKKCLFYLLDFHPYVNEPRITRKLRDLINTLQSSSSSVVILASQLTLPPELEKDIAVIDYPLPDLTSMKAMFATIEEGLKQNPRFSIHLNEEEKDLLLQAVLGFTENEAKNVFAKALVADSELSIAALDIIISEKEQIIRKSGVLEFCSVKEDFSSLGGMDELKSWLKLRSASFSKRAREFQLPPPKGLLLIGVPGCGKSLAAKTVASEWKQPLLRMDVGKLFGGLVGSSEANIRRTIQFAEAVAPAILWIDEIEKGFSGVKSLGDSGTTARVFSTFLTWLQEKQSRIFVMATANDISALPPEFLRKGRFDEIFFVDLPFIEERAEIMRIHLLKRGRDPERLGIDLHILARESEGFSGAELEQAVVSALYKAFSINTDLNTEIIASCLQETYPLSETMKEPVRAMREWSRNRARYATRKWRDTQGKIQPVERWASLGTAQAGASDVV
ncbi:MAG TPA: AAA family ATPase [Candidatus Angelobacter sp.]|nr:AAA family ATPase [Candidatus Angelobacter sp.]